MSMPFAVNLIGAPPLKMGSSRATCSLARRRARADLIVGTEPTHLVRGRRLEVPRADAGRRALDRGTRALEIGLRGAMTPGQPRFEEAELHGRGQGAGRRPLREGVDLELQAVPRALIRLLLFGHVARLVIDHDGAIRRHVDAVEPAAHARRPEGERDRKSTRLNSSHLGISYAVFCLKKKKKMRESR